jgi:hypothetical protein
MFTLFYTALHRTFGPEALKIAMSLAVLSDEGVGIKKFCHDNNIKQFLCYRHLINKFGPGTDIATLVSKMLFTQTREDYAAQRELNFMMAAIILSKDGKHLHAFEDLFGVKLDPLKKPENNPWTRVDDRYEAQALWTRAISHIATCSNHAERFHRTLKAQLCNTSSFAQKIHAFHHEINKKTIGLSQKGESRKGLRTWMSQLKTKQIMSFDKLTHIPLECLCTHCPRIALIRNRFQHFCPCIHQLQAYEASQIIIDDNPKIIMLYHKHIPIVEPEPIQTWVLPTHVTKPPKPKKIPFDVTALDSFNAVVATEIKELARVVRSLWSPFEYPCLQQCLQHYWDIYTVVHDLPNASIPENLPSWCQFSLKVWEAARKKDIRGLGYPTNQNTIVEDADPDETFFFMRYHTLQNKKK